MCSSDLEEEEEEEEAQPTDQVRTLAKEFTIKVSQKGIGGNLAAETSIKVNHVRNVIIESDDEVIHAVEMLKEMQHTHNAVARSLRSEALAREILEVTMVETRLLTHTGLLDESDGGLKTGWDVVIAALLGAEIGRASCRERV